jgi:hypothetical protein
MQGIIGIIVVDVFSTLDGIYQAPGGTNEDREGGFEFGGWQAPYFDKKSGRRSAPALIAWTRDLARL